MEISLQSTACQRQGLLDHLPVPAAVSHLPPVCRIREVVKIAAGVVFYRSVAHQRPHQQIMELWLLRRRRRDCEKLERPTHPPPQASTSVSLFPLTLGRKSNATSMAETKRTLICWCGDVEMELVGAPLASLHVSCRRMYATCSSSAADTVCVCSSVCCSGQPRRRSEIDRSCVVRLCTMCCWQPSRPRSYCHPAKATWACPALPWAQLSQSLHTQHEL